MPLGWMNRWQFTHRFIGASRKSSGNDELKHKGGNIEDAHSHTFTPQSKRSKSSKHPAIYKCLIDMFWNEGILLSFSKKTTFTCPGDEFKRRFSWTYSLAW